MERYDPLKAPDPEAWLALSESERLRLVKAYHFRIRPKIERLDLHSGLHVGVENQAALGDETPVRAALARLVQQGARDRHEAVHAVAATLLDFMRSVAARGEAGEDPNAAYFEAVKKLTMKSYRRDYG